jgi:1-acyl-sn-glycerol-3-phosphate acyltransferase
VVWACVCFLAAPFPYNTRFYITSRWNVFVIWCARVICGIRYQVKGYENLPDAPAILLSKHQSAWETIFLLPNMKRPLVYVFKKEILYIPFFGWGMALLRMIPIDRSKGKNAFANVVRARQAPPGRRPVDHHVPGRDPHRGRRKGQVQERRHAPGDRDQHVVVPIAHNSGECWPKNSFIKRPGLITVSIGKPIAPENHTPTA